MEIKTIGQLIQHIATKAGVDIDDKSLINVLSNSDLSKITIDKELVKTIEENLISVESAKDNHPAIASHYKFQVLSGLDASIERILNESDLPEDVKENIRKTKSSHKRNELLINAIQQHKKDHSDKGDKIDKSALQSQIDALQNEIRNEKALREEERLSYEKKRNNDLMAFELKRKIFSKKTIFDELPEDVRFATIKNLIDKELKDNDAQFSFDEKGSFSLLKSDGSKFYGTNNLLVEPDNFVDKILSKHKIIKVIPDQPTIPNTVVNIQNLEEKPGNGNNRRIAEAARASREAMQKQATQLN